MNRLPSEAPTPRTNPARPADTHRQVHGHSKWAYSDRSFVWNGDTPKLINLQPAATELLAWIRGQTNDVTYLPEDFRILGESFSNPYSYHATTISAILREVINATHSFETSNCEISPFDAEVTRIRICNEFALYSTRFLEAAIKQLLYLTDFDERAYKDATLMALLSRDCKPCRKKGTPHNQSMLVSLAHPYHLCREFEGCLFGHISEANKRRNAEAAHSETLKILKCSVDESRQKMKEYSRGLFNELGHMLDHLQDLEERMSDDLDWKFARCVSGDKTVSHEPEMRWRQAPNPLCPIPKR